MKGTTRLTIIIALAIALAPMATAAERVHVDWSPLEAAYQAVAESLEAFWVGIDAKSLRGEKSDESTDDAGPMTLPDGAGPMTLPDGAGPMTLPDG